MKTLVPVEVIESDRAVKVNIEIMRALEKYLKSGMGKRYLRNRLKRFLSLTG